MLGNFTDNKVRYGIARAVQNDDATAIYEFIQNGADPNTVDSENISLLHHAVMIGAEKAVRELIKLGANPNKLGGPSGYTAFHFAVYKDKPAMIDVLIDTKQADLSVCSSDQYSPFHLAAHLGRVEAAEKLLKHGINIEAKTHNGATADDVAKLQFMEAEEHEGDTEPFRQIFKMIASKRNENSPPAQNVRSAEELATHEEKVAVAFRNNITAFHALRPSRELGF